MADKVNIIVGAAFAAYGLMGLIGIWLVPAIGNSRLYGLTMLTRSSSATRLDRTFMALSCVLSGACTASLALGLREALSVFIFGILLWASARAAIWYRRNR